MIASVKIRHHSQLGSHISPWPPAREKQEEVWKSDKGEENWQPWYCVLFVAVVSA